MTSRNSGPGEEIENNPSTMHSLNWHLLDIYYISVTNEHAEASNISRTQLSPQSRAEDESNTQKVLCSVVRPKERYVHLKPQKKEVGYHEWHGKVTYITNNYTSYLKEEGIRCLTKYPPVCHILTPLVDYTREHTMRGPPRSILGLAGRVEYFLNALMTHRPTSEWELEKPQRRSHMMRSRRK